MLCVCITAMADDSPSGSPRERSGSWLFPGGGGSGAARMPPPSPERNLAFALVRSKKMVECTALAHECYTRLDALLSKHIIDEKSNLHTKEHIDELIQKKMELATAPEVFAVLTLVRQWIDKIGPHPISLHMDLNIKRHSVNVTTTGGCYIDSPITLAEVKIRLDECYKNIVELSRCMPLSVLSISPANTVCGIGDVHVTGIVSEDINKLLQTWIESVNRFKHEHHKQLKEQQTKVGPDVTSARICVTAAADSIR